MIMACHFRLGDLKYKDMYKSYGITNIEVRHLKIKTNTADISFIGKKGVKNDCDLDDVNVINHLKNMIHGKDKKDPVFTYNTGDCIEHVRATDVNEWMRALGVNITSKMFRTYATNIMLIELCRAMGNPEKDTISQRKKNLNGILDGVSSMVHNTRAVCKKEYIHPDLTEMYVNNPRKFKNKFMGADDPDKAFLTYLKSL